MENKQGSVRVQIEEVTSSMMLPNEGLKRGSKILSHMASKAVQGNLVFI
jgi:hypothetical protein